MRDCVTLSFTVSCELANNQRLVQILENVRDLVDFMGMQGLNTKGRAEVVIREHEGVLDTVAERNPVKARKAMEAR
jgi:DNA-binding FadR family transcriptional regulator